MSGLWVLLLLILIAALPVLPVYVWLRSQDISTLWFVLSLVTGAVSLLIAGLLQTFFFYIAANYRQVLEEAVTGIQFFTIFIQIALTEEAGRLLALGLFFRLGRSLRNRSDLDESQLISFGAATGLIAGLGFGIIETASYGAGNVAVALLRAFTATPLHGACGARVGIGAIMFKYMPIRSAGRFLSAVAIHGMYNLMVISPGIPRIFSVLIAVLSLVSSIQVIRKP
ncbi:MAG: PrsW family intramembrane metalloprotease [Spirochaetaceae bacterium]|jgi:RsiW-degrading membrane proteinase PrsW (M82 family)|nr:PrsW family intramembrane metalloprotease [Spirochaetaceae bacterium]